MLNVNTPVVMLQAVPPIQNGVSVEEAEAGIESLVKKTEFQLKTLVEQRDITTFTTITSALLTCFHITVGSHRF